MVPLVVVVLLLGLSACSGGTSDAEDEACNSIHAWETGGGQADRFDQAVASAQEELADSDHDSLIAAADELDDGAEEDRSASVESFLAQCTDLGWEPAEG
ncbi:hypothetical protein [Isoptericola dokdonensis]|uniref:Secreted protein n=1 Tax=Isoptericola dokdonensis DS-3 TaxID=1300344 RepID=A0A161IJW7_9MICO|nr:hypothetical protein [Isoptericola dokdonensis]ANC32394.1 hypothetical protein I598_2876 [Isoptericola dokdonensis DS-3]